MVDLFTEADMDLVTINGSLRVKGGGSQCMAVANSPYGQLCS
jgi:hypothetical protein